ncbi:MAG: molecular chaperone GrpE [Candidatus Sumerlaeota bacterium]|nr:molecular chaperone GrpE [Candidatus Sumerlaeota bacterium]
MDLPKPRTRVIGGPAPTPTPSPAAPGVPLGGLRKRRKYRLRRRSYNSQPLVETTGGAAAAPSISPEILEQLKAEKQAAEKEREELKEQVLRGRADLENQRRRHLKEKDELRKYATEDLLHSIVPALDHFGLALQSLESATDVDSVRQGVVMIHRELMGVLASNGLQVIDPMGETFDPALHEAVATECFAEKADGEIVEVLRPGWRLKERVLRPAMVKVNKPNADTAGTPPKTPVPDEPST